MSPAIVEMAARVASHAYALKKLIEESVPREPATVRCECGVVAALRVVAPRGTGLILTLPPNWIARRYKDGFGYACSTRCAAASSEVSPVEHKPRLGADAIAAAELLEEALASEVIR